MDVAWRTFRRCLLGNRGPTLSERKKKETQREIFKLFLRGKKEEEECSEKKLEIFQKKGRKDERKIECVEEKKRDR